MPFQPRPELIKALQSIAEDLFDAVDPGRVTIRVDTTNDPDFPVLGEVCAPGLISLTGGMTLMGYKPVDLHSAPTVQYMNKERKLIVQRDVRVDAPQIPELIDLYGCSSQVLSPIQSEGRFVGVISVHNVDPRDWTEHDIAAIEGATGRVQRELEQASWFDVR